jgi:hypothetical protein
MDQPVAFTFVCLADNQVASFVDVQVLSEGAHRAHALQLLREHASAVTVEVWRGEAVWEAIGRDGVRMIATRTEVERAVDDLTGDHARSARLD